MNISSFIPLTSFFFNQILDDIKIGGVILSHNIMEKYNQHEILDLVKTINLENITYEKYQDISIFVVKSIEDDQIWLVKYQEKTILMLSSEY